TATVRVSSAKATAHGTVLRMSASGASVSPGTQRLGSVGGGGASAIATVRAPSDAEGGVITVRASVSAAKARGASRSYKLIVTDASGALPPGVSLANLPPGVPPLTPDEFNPLAGMKGPQVALPPIASPQIAPSPAPLVAVAGLSTVGEEELFTVERLSSVQAGFLAAMGVSVMLLLLRLRLARRAYVALPWALRRRLRLKTRRVTAARLRALPPQPAPVRPAVRLVWLPVRPARL
ncbi:hypothetical protein, partial [Actinomadura sp. KC345]|uniref:hypothetical protein n=1 Tax=Actinomadura sp. KC345 TaxID=2530371 RepID=UPI001A9D25EC